jgi:branched-chain amino acid transport system permease protein
MELLDAIVQGVLVGGLFALAATGLSLMFGVMRIVNLAHGDLGILAAYLGYVTISHGHLPTWLAVVVGAVVFGALGYVVQRTLLQRSLNVSVLATLLVTFGLSVVIQNALLEAFSADPKAIDAGGLSTSSFHLGSITISWLSLLTFALAIVVIAAIQLFLSRTAQGRMMRATADDPQIAALVGSNSRHIYGIATALAFATIALAGMMQGMRSSISPTLGTSSLIFAFEAVVIGGLGSLWGTLLGGMVLGVTQTVCAYFDPSLSLLGGHLMFLLVLALRPQGLIPARQLA